MVLKKTVLFILEEAIRFLVMLLIIQLFLTHTIAQVETSNAEVNCLEPHDPIRLIPFNEIWEDILVANQYDPEAKAAFDFIGSEEFLDKLAKLESSSEFQAFIEVCKAMNIRVPEAIEHIKNSLSNFVKKINCTPPSSADFNPEEISGGVHGLVMRIFVNRLPVPAIEETFKVQQQCDAKIKEKITNLQSPEFKAALSKLQSTAEYKGFFDELEDYNIFLNAYLNYNLKFLGVES